MESSKEALVNPCFDNLIDIPSELWFNNGRNNDEIFLIRLTNPVAQGQIFRSDIGKHDKIRPFSFILRTSSLDDLAAIHQMPTRTENVRYDPMVQIGRLNEEYAYTYILLVAVEARVRDRSCQGLFR